MQRSLNIFIAEKGYEDENFKKEKASIIGELSTSEGRTLKFIVIQRNNDPIKDIRNSNAINNTIRNNTVIKKQDGSWKVNIKNSNFEDMKKILEQNISLSHSVLFEFISTTLSRIFRDNLMPEGIKNQSEARLYLNKVEKLPTKNNVFDLLAQGIEIKYIQSKFISPDVIFYTFEIKIPSDQIINVTISYNRIFE